MKIVWITWEDQRRNKPIADELGAIFYQLIDTLKCPSWKRYAINLWRTFEIIWNDKPDVVITQNPSIVLSVFAVVLSIFFGYRVGTDTHNVGFGLKSDVNSIIIRALCRWVQQYAHFVIAHNDELREKVVGRGGNIIVLPDKIPTINKPKKLKQLNGEFNFLFICSFAKDEPWMNVIKTFQELDPKYHVYVTGDYKKIGMDPSIYPSNIHVTGRIPWEEFDQMLYAVHAVFDLTSRENCLLCGAYEAVACGTPLILSKSKTLTKYFRKGAEYTDNSVESLKHAVLSVELNYEALADEIAKLKPQLEKDWERRIRDLKETIQLKN